MADSVGLFFSLSTQWRWASAGMAGAFKTGLEYASIAPAALGLGVEVTPRVFNDLRLLEAEALKVWSRK